MGALVGPLIVQHMVSGTSQYWSQFPMLQSFGQC